ncbi:MAG: class I adenylate cyclase [Gammaproteobacteria bacterium]|nr:class I adenylate cyclase [Gammaproteobacteria bacterium]
MSRHPSDDPALLLDFKEIKQRFVSINQARLQRAKADMRLRQLDFIELLPLLFHTNHPLLPGYVNKTTAAGIPEYTPSAKSLQLAKRIAKSFSFKQRVYRRYPIHALYLMGSTGTIAYSSESDFDIWVCYDSNLSESEIAALQKKTAAIEKFAASLEVDASLFLVDPERFAQGQHGQLSSESSGSALHFLLLEEFYRTGLLLAGRYPLWWLVPPEQDANYAAYVADIKHKRYIHSRDHIDFGGLQHIPAEEFYGATLWLLFKGINSPYKSIIKTLLMEAYASEYPAMDLLGTRFKKAIYQGENEINKLDPYLMMLHKVEQYLQNKPDLERLELIRRCFYFKINEKLSLQQPDEESWRCNLLTELVQAWGWSTSQLFILDSKDNWNIPRVMRERNALIHEMTSSYRFLSDFARNKSGLAKIKPADLTTLGRKLYAAFERKAGKIEIIYRGITHNLYASHLSLHQLIDPEQREFWVVFSGVVNPAEVATATPLKRAHNIVELIAWCYFNTILSSTTVINIHTLHSVLSDKEVAAIVANLAKSFDAILLSRDNLADLRKPAYICQALTLVNVGVDPFSAHTRRGEHLTSNRTDSLRFGGRLENLTLRIDQIIVTSWQEVLTSHFVGIEGLFQCLQACMAWSPPSSAQRPAELNACSYSSYRGDAIARRLEELFSSVYDCFYNVNYFPNSRYIIAIEWDYYILGLHDDTLVWSKLGTIDKLRLYLAKPSTVFRHLVFDPSTQHDDMAAFLYRYNGPGMVQCFIHIQANRAMAYIIDERGSYFTQETDFYDASTLINHYQGFFANIHRRMQFFNNLSASRSKPPLVEFYFLNKDVLGRWQVIEHRHSNIFKPANFISLLVIVDYSGESLSLRIYCEDREFSSLEYGTQLYPQVAQHMLSLRQAGDKYPIYITDIDLPRSLLGEELLDVQSIHYLRYKREIEDALYQAIHQS